MRSSSKWLVAATMLFGGCTVGSPLGMSSKWNYADPTADSWAASYSEFMAADQQARLRWCKTARPPSRGPGRPAVGACRAQDINADCCDAIIEQYLRSAFLHAHPNLGPQVRLYVSTGKVDLDPDPKVVIQRSAAANDAAAAQRELRLEQQRAEAREKARERAASEDERREAAARGDYYEVEGRRPGRDSVACAKIEDLEHVLEAERGETIVVDRGMDSDVQRLGCFIVRRGDSFLCVEHRGDYRRVVSGNYGTEFWMPAADLRRTAKRR